MLTGALQKKIIYLYSLLFVGAGIFYSTKADILIANHPDILPTHKKVLKPSQVKTQNDFLLVGLKAYLGQENNQSISQNLLHLISERQNLILRDSQGIIHKSSNIKIGWRKIPLTESIRIARQVAGPFSSFESAQNFSLNLEKIGIQSVIAHPKDWEVWVAQHVRTPKELNMQIFSKNINFVIQPVLKGRNGDLLLSGPISIEAPDGLLWNGGRYSGPFLLKPDAYGTWTFIEQVLFPQYLKGVLPHEIGASSPPNALAVQAVLARTWALANSHRFAIDGYHLCSDTQCQVYKNPRKASLQVKKAINLTKGKFLSWKGRPIHAVYHANNGGIMASASEAWSIGSLPYLKVRLDGSGQLIEKFRLPLKNNVLLTSFLSFKEGLFGNDHYLFRWKRIWTAERIKIALNSFYPAFGYPEELKVLTRGPSSRVVALQIVGSVDKSSITIHRDNIRRIFRDLPSTLFVITQLREGVWEISGGGFGHGVGMSQSGAIDLARRGWNVDKILMHYYPGSEYETLP